jgi:hypothetical protein
MKLASSFLTVQLQKGDANDGGGQLIQGSNETGVHELFRDCPHFRLDD